MMMMKIWLLRGFDDRQRVRRANARARLEAAPARPRKAKALLPFPFVPSHSLTREDSSPFPPRHEPRSLSAAQTTGVSLAFVAAAGPVPACVRVRAELS